MEQDQALQPLNVIDRNTGQQRIKLSQRCRPVAGIFLCVFSALTLVACNLFVKLCLVIPAFEIGIIQFAIQLVVTIPTLIYSNDNVIFSPKITALLVLRGFGGATSMVTRFYASQNMPLGDATVLLFTTPVFVAILARIFLKERLHWIYSILLVLCLAGVTLIARPTFIFGHPDTVPEYNNILVPSLVALLSTVASACNTVVLRKK
ncbi:Solute carrier family 35 member G1 [Exaiptasia diaphana]|nr:Solute carrier family 35 member G1 [Exaiptasia diaphana]